MIFGKSKILIFFSKKSEKNQSMPKKISGKNPKKNRKKIQRGNSTNNNIKLIFYGGGALQALSRKSNRVDSASW